MEFSYLSRDLWMGFRKPDYCRSPGGAQRREERRANKAAEKMCVGGEGVGEESPGDFFSNICLWLFQIKDLILDWGINKEVPWEMEDCCEEHSSACS